MKNLSKTVITAILIFCMVMPVISAAADDKGLSEAISCAKSFIDIPDAYDDFDYSRNETAGGNISWNLYWRSKDDRSSMNITVCGGKVTNYSKYDSNADNYGRLTELTYAQAQETAEAFLRKMLPELAPKMRIYTSKNNPVSSYHSTDYVYTFLRYENDIPTVDTSCRIGVDKYTNTVASYSFSDSNEKTDFSVPESIIAEDAARQAFLENIGIELMYRSYYDYKEQTLSVFPVYRFKNSFGKAVNAADGSVIAFESSGEEENRNLKQLANEAAADTEYGASGGGSSFSKIELDAIENISTLISKQNAVDKMKAAIPDIPDDADIQCSLYTNSFNGEKNYCWQLSVSADKNYSARASVDALAGEILSFSIYDASETKAEPVSYEEARKKAEALAKRISPVKFADTSFREEENYRTMPKYDDYGYTFSFARTVNGTVYPDNYISVTYDNKAGRISRYNCTWYDNAEFPSLSAIIPADKAADAAFDYCGYSLVYENGKLVYDFMDSSGYNFSAEDASPVNYRGKPLTDKMPKTAYTDIAGHWSEKIVNLLWNNDIYKPSALFKPDEYISKADFVKFLVPETIPFTVKEMENYYGLPIEINEENSGKPLTRSDAAEILAEQLGCGEIGRKSEIFKNPFNDAIESEYVGFAAICNAYGIICGDESGNFNGSDYITNAEAAVMVYNYMTKK